MAFRAQFLQELRLPLVVIAAGLFFALTSCGTVEVLYVDTSAKLAAPELLTAWSATGLPPSPLVQLTLSGVSEITADLKQRKPAPQGVLLATEVAKEQIVQWKKDYPKTRFVVIQFQSSDAAAWKDLAQHAASDAQSAARAVAVLSTTAKPETIQALQEGWRLGGGKSPIDLVLWDPKLTVPETELRQLVNAATTDLFVLGVDPTRVVIPAEASRARIHRDIAWTGPEVPGGWRIRLSPPQVGSVLHAALRPGGPDIAHLPWEIVPKTPLSRS